VVASLLSLAAGYCGVAEGHTPSSRRRRSRAVRRPAGRRRSLEQRRSRARAS